MNRKNTFSTVVLLFCSLAIFAQPEKDTVAMLVDSLLYPPIKDEIDAYVSSVEAEFPVKLLVFHDHDWKNKSFYETREFIKEQWIGHNIKGVILVGYFPLMLYQVVGQGSFPMVQTIGYEDLDGDFFDKGTANNSGFIEGADDPSTYTDAYGRSRSFNDTIYDHHSWGDNIDFSSYSEIKEKVKLEIWCALIRPCQDTYQDDSYSENAVRQMKNYLARCTRYSRKELPYMKRALVQSSHDWSNQVQLIASKLEAVYGKENIAAYPSSSSGYSYMRERATGLEIACYFAHSSSWFHQNDRPPMAEISTSDLISENGPGSLLTLGFNCHGADYLETPTGCLGQQYIFEGLGLSFLGNTISTGNYQLAIVSKLTEGKYLGQAFIESLEEDYQASCINNNEVRNQQLWGNIILGNPFIWVCPDKDMSYRGARVEGSTSNGEDAVLTVSKNNKLYTISETHMGQVNISGLDTGIYSVEIETMDGLLLPGKEINISTPGQLISGWDIEVQSNKIDFPGTYYMAVSSTDNPSTDWNSDGAKLDSWTSSTSRIFGRNTQDFSFLGHLDLGQANKNIYIRKHFTVYKREQGSKVYLYSANTDPEIFVNGIRAVDVGEIRNRNRYSAFRSKIDISGLVKEGANYLTGRSEEFIHISRPDYIMGTISTTVIPDPPSGFSAVSYNNRIYFKWDKTPGIIEGYILEAKKEDGSFETVAIINRENNKLTHDITGSGKDYIYRICSYNYAGRSGYSEEINTSSALVTGIVAYPNPAYNELILKNTIPGSEIYITNLSGKNLFRTVATGLQTSIDLRPYIAGMYYIVIIMPDKEIITRRIIKTSKFINR